MKRCIHFLSAGLVGLLLALASGCGPRPSSDPPPGLTEAERGKLCTNAADKWEGLRKQVVAPEVRAAAAAADTADKGPQALQAAVVALAKAPPGPDEGADKLVRQKAVEDVFKAGLLQLDGKQVLKQSGEELAPALKRLAETVKDPDVQKLSKALADVAAAGPPDGEKAKDAAAKAMDDAVQVVQAPRAAPAAADPELKRLADDLDHAKRDIETAAKAGQDVSQAVRKFVELSHQADTRMGRLLLEGADGAEKVLSPALSIARTIGEVADLAKNWKNLDDVQKIAGVAGALANALAAAQPFLAAAVAEVKVPVMLALMVVSELLPKIHMGDLSLPGGLKGGSQDKPSGGGDKPSGDSKDKPTETAQGPGKDPGKETPKPADRPEATAAAAVEAELPDNKTPADESAKSVARGLQRRFNLTDAQTAKADAAVKKALSGLPTAPAAQRVRETTRAVEEAVPEVRAQAEKMQPALDGKAEEVRKEVEKAKAEGVEGEGLREAAARAALKASGVVGASEVGRVELALKDVAADDADALGYAAVLAVWKNRADTLPAPTRPPE